MKYLFNIFINLKKFWQFSHFENFLSFVDNILDPNLKGIRNMHIPKIQAQFQRSKSRLKNYLPQKIIPQKIKQTAMKRFFQVQ